MSLVAVIGLVLSITGSAFTAITALRSNWQSMVSEHRKDANGWCQSLENAKNNAMASGYKKHQCRFAWGVWGWETSKWCPIALLGLVSIAISCDVFFLDWTESDTQFFSSRPPYWVSIYKWTLGGVIALDIIAIIATYLFFRRICDAADELERNFIIYEEQEAKANTEPSNVASSAALTPASSS